MFWLSVTDHVSWGTQGVPLVYVNRNADANRSPFSHRASGMNVGFMRTDLFLRTAGRALFHVHDGISAGVTVHVDVSDSVAPDISSST